MKSFKEFLTEARGMPPALKKKISDIESGKFDSALNDMMKKAKKFDNKQIIKAIENRKDAIIEGGYKKGFSNWFKEFSKAAHQYPEFNDPFDIANSAGLDMSFYEMNSREIDKEVKKATGSRNLEDFVKSIGK